MGEMMVVAEVVVRGLSRVCRGIYFGRQLFFFPTCNLTTLVMSLSVIAIMRIGQAAFLFSHQTGKQIKVYKVRNSEQFLESKKSSYV